MKHQEENMTFKRKKKQKEKNKIKIEG